MMTVVLRFDNVANSTHVVIQCLCKEMFQLWWHCKRDHQTWTPTDFNHSKLIIPSLIQLTNGLDELSLATLSTEVQVYRNS